ncbi:MAG: hypothetical protein V4772_08765 [Pseudomonadota bacterium]
MTDRETIHEASIERMKALTFGDPVTNICAGDSNPSLHCFFVAYEVKANTNKYGITHRSHWAKCTDKKGKFWNTGFEVVYPGHLDAETRTKLFTPVWESQYGKKEIEA